MAVKEDDRRLPPGQYLTREFPVSHVGLVPHFDPESWDLRVYGLVESPLTLTHEEFRALPQVERVADYHCVTTWSNLDNRWQGILLRDLLLQARPLPEARFVLVHADGGYTTNLLLSDLLDEAVVIAHRRNGEDLPPEQGFPARLVVPGKYGYKSAKWVRGFELLSEDRPGFWESRGYSTTADPMKEDRFSPD